MVSQENYMKFNDAVIGSVLLVFSILLLLHVQSFPSMPLSVYGPASFPRLLGIILGICSIVLIIRGIQDRKEVPLLEIGPWRKLPVRWRRMAMIPLTVIGYIYLAGFLGYVIYVFISLSLLLIDFNGGRWKFSLLSSGIFTVITYLVFVKLLLVPLPAGLLSGIL